MFPLVRLLVNNGQGLDMWALILGIAIGAVGTLAFAALAIVLLRSRLRDAFARIIRNEIADAHEILLADLAAIVRSLRADTAAEAALTARLAEAFEKPRHLRAVSDTFAG